MTDNFDYLVKILLIGESGVGKTCVLEQFIESKFTTNHLPTIAIDFRMKILKINNIKLKMQLWDTAGQERFNTLTTGFFKSSHGVIIIYSITDKNSFEKVFKWMDQISLLGPKGVKIILVGNKNDLDDKREVSYEQGRDLAKDFDIPFFETSAKTGREVDDVFKKVGEDILNDSDFSDSTDNTTLNYILDGPKKNKKKCCK